MKAKDISRKIANFATFSNLFDVVESSLTIFCSQSSAAYPL